jgi:hypothetical protein
VRCAGNNVVADLPLAIIKLMSSDVVLSPDDSSCRFKPSTCHGTKGLEVLKRGIEMTGKKPKDLLSDYELIGFTRRLGKGDQVVRRASSAKVTAVEPTVPTPPKRRLQRSETR